MHLDAALIGWELGLQLPSGDPKVSRSGGFALDVHLWHGAHLANRAAQRDPSSPFAARWYSAAVGALQWQEPERAVALALRAPADVRRDPDVAFAVATALEWLGDRGIRRFVASMPCRIPEHCYRAAARLFLEIPQDAEVFLQARLHAVRLSGRLDSRVPSAEIARLRAGLPPPDLLVLERLLAAPTPAAPTEDHGRAWSEYRRGPLARARAMLDRLRQEVVSR